MPGLALSLFPGLGVLDMAFEGAGWCVVRGPDVVWQADVRGWHVPEGAFDGVFGGPPCQMFSSLAALARAQGHGSRHGNLIPEFERIVGEARPRWFLMENVANAPLPEVDGYDLWPHEVTDWQVGGSQTRKRRFSLGLREPWPHAHSPWSALGYREDGAPSVAAVTGRGYEAPSYPSSRRRKTVNAQGLRFPMGGRRDDDGNLLTSNLRPMPPDTPLRLTVGEMLEAQGLPPDLLDESPYTMAGKRSLAGNAVPLAMGRAVAAVVRHAVS